MSTMRIADTTTGAVIMIMTTITRIITTTMTMAGSVVAANIESLALIRD